ncbi:hypothetical protein ACNKHO_25975 [Shigella flexneri]
MIDEVVDFRQAMARLYREFTDNNDLVLQAVVQRNGYRPKTDKEMAFEDAPAELLKPRPELSLCAAG